MRSQAALEKSLQQLGFGYPPKVIHTEMMMMSLVARQLLAAASGGKWQQISLAEGPIPVGLQDVYPDVGMTHVVQESLEAMTEHYLCECCHVDPGVEQLSWLELKSLVVRELIFVGDLTHFVNGGLVCYAHRGYD